MRLVIPTTALALFTLGCMCGVPDFLEEKVNDKVGEQLGEFIVEQAAGVEGFDVEDEGGKVSIKTDQGNFQINQGEVPADFPLALPSGATVAGSMNIDTPEGKTWQVTASCSQSVQELGDFYQKELEGKGVKVERADVSGSGAMVMLSGENATHTFQVSAVREGEVTQLVVMAGGKGS